MNTDLSGPNVVEGAIYMFTNDGPIESLDAGADMITWWDKPVQLTPDIIDDGASALTCAWTIGALPSGVTAVFDPSTDVAAPLITVTKAPYTNADIVNAGFEAEVLGEDGWGGAPGWTQLGRMGNWNPPADAYDGSAVPEGVMCAWAQTADGGLAQVLTETLAPDTDYTLTVEVGNSNRYDWTGYKVQLLAGGTVIAEDDNTLTPTAGTFATSTVDYSYVPEDANKVGLPLEIRLLAGSQAPGYAECNFDAVELTADPPFPAPEGVSSIDLTLTVNDETNPAVSDTMAIDIYGDACQAARVGVGLDVKTDYNVNCSVDTGDLAIIAAAWLDDFSATDFVRAEEGPELAGPLGVLDVTGINPATGVQWAAGDEYRLAFVTSVTRDTTDPDIATYDAFVQDAAEAAGLGGVTWKCVTSTYGTTGGDYNAIRDANVGRMATEVPTYLVDGTTKLWDAFLDGYPVNTYSVTETGGSYLGIVGTGGGRLVGDPTQTKIEYGDSSRTDGAWYRVYNGLQTSEWHFYAVSEPLTLAIPIVDAGDNISTWLDKEVTLAPTVSDPNNPGALFDYNWTAYPDGDPKIGVAISNPADANPTVTVTKVPYLKPFLPNGSFEIVTVDGGQVVQSYRDYWGQYDRPAGATVSARQYVPNTTYHFPEDENTPPDGDIICRANTSTGESRPDGPAILLGDVAYDPTATYELSVAVGHPHAVPDNAAYNDDTWRGYLVQLVVGGQFESTGSGPDNIYGGTVVAEDANSIDIPRREWRTSVVTLDPSPGLADLAGQPIQIRLLSPDDPDPEYFSQTKAFFDNVVLKINGETAEYVTDPGTISVTMLLSVNKQGETETAVDRVKIDVYEDACEMASVLDPSVIAVTDFDLDCVTNLVDFAVFAEDWLLDYALMEPQAKPE